MELSSYHRLETIGLHCLRWYEDEMCSILMQQLVPRHLITVHL